MPIDGYANYERREYCHDVKCPIQALLDKEPEGSQGIEEIRRICMNHCIHTTYEFHHWLTRKGYLLVRPNVIPAKAGIQGS